MDFNNKLNQRINSTSDMSYVNYENLQVLKRRLTHTKNLIITGLVFTLVGVIILVVGGSMLAADTPGFASISIMFLGGLLATVVPIVFKVYYTGRVWSLRWEVENKYVTNDQETYHQKADAVSALITAKVLVSISWIALWLILDFVAIFNLLKARNILDTLSKN